MNILFLCDEYPPCQHGGIGSVTQNIARELVFKGHQVSVCGFYPYYRSAPAFESDSGVKIYRRFYGNRLLLKLSRNQYFGNIVNIDSQFNSYTRFLKELIQKNKIDIIEIPDFNEAFRYSGPRFISFPDLGIPSVIKLHGNFSFFNYLNKGMITNARIYEKEACLIHRADHVLAISSFTKKIAQNIFNYQSEISVIYNGITATDAVTYKENSNCKSVVFAGTLADKKGIFSLIKAWETVVAEIPSARLSLYGKGSIEMIAKINSLISDKTRKTIELKGYVSKKMLMEIYNTATCTIFPSYAESFSMAPMESMLAGCPTIYTKRASGDELITNNINGLLIDPDSVKEISTAIIRMLSDRESALEMGIKGAELIRRKFNISVIADDHIKLYESVLR